jgi:hypothetical protein
MGRQVYVLYSRVFIVDNKNIVRIDCRIRNFNYVFFVVLYRLLVLRRRRKCRCLYIVSYYILLKNDFRNKILRISIHLNVQRHDRVDSNKYIASLRLCQPDYFFANRFYINMTRPNRKNNRAVET